MLRAFDLGILHLQGADLDDPATLLQIQFAVRAAQDKDHKYLLQLRMMQHLAVADYNADNDQFSHHWDAANDLMDDIIAIAQPWIGNAKQNKAQRLQEIYRQLIGDPNDPELQQRFMQLKKQWERDYAEVYGEPLSE